MLLLELLIGWLRSCEILLHRRAGRLRVVFCVMLCLGMAVQRTKSVADIVDGSPTRKALPTEAEAAVETEKLRRLVEQLGSDSFSERRLAFSELWRLGSSVSEQLESVAELEDKQVAESLGRLRLLIKIRNYCDDLPTARELMGLLETPDEANLIKLAQAGHWQLLQVFLDQHPALVMRNRESFYQQEEPRRWIQRLVDLALEQKSVELAWPIVARMVPFELAAWTAAHLELGLPTEPEDEHERALQLFLSGHVDQSLLLNISPHLKLRLATRGFQWQLLKEPALERALLEGNQSTSQQAARAVLLEFAGDPVAAEQQWASVLAPLGAPKQSQGDDGEKPEEVSPILQALRSAASPSQDPSSLHQLLFSLLLSGQTDALGAFLPEYSSSIAFDFFIASNDYGSAFQQVGLQGDLSNFDQWLEQLDSEAAATLPEALRSPVEDPQSLRAAVTLGRVGSTLVGLGYRAEASRILERLVRLGQKSYRRQNPVWDRCILRFLGRDEWRSCCLEVIGRQWDSLPSTHRQAILARLFPELGTVAWNLLSEAPAMTEDMPQEQRMALALKQLDNLERCDRRFFGNDSQVVVKEWIYRAIKRSDGDEESVFLDHTGWLSLAKLCHCLGYSSMALDLLNRGMTASQDAYRLVHFAAQISADAQNAESALSYLNSVKPSMLDEHRDLAARIDARLILGQFEQARQEHLAYWLRFSGVSWNGDRSAGYRATEDLISDHRWELAMSVAARNFYLDRFVNYYFGFWEARQYSRVLQEQKKYQQSADVMRAVFVELLRPFSQTLRVFVENEELSLLSYCAVRERISRAVASIEKQDFLAAQRELEIAYRLQPLDIEAVVNCFPPLVAAGQTEMAEELFRRYSDSVGEHLRSWPNDAMNLNNLAWMYTQCERELDRALELSQRAVQLAPSSAVYLDTLAEVHFRRGNSQKAVELMRECVYLDPREPHYRENLDRFSNR